MNRYFGYLLGLTLVAPTGALIAKYATAWIAGFKPRYLKALISTIVAYAVVTVVGLALDASGAFESLSRGSQLLGSWAALTCAHINLLRSDAGDFLGVGKAMIVAFCQVLGTIAAMLLLVLLMVLIKRALL